MTGMYPILHFISPFILAVNTSHDSLIWNVLLLFFIISGVAVTIVLYLYSHKPEDWKHEPKTDGGYQSGRLADLDKSIKINSVDVDQHIHLHKLIQSIFFEKFRSNHGVSPEELMDLNTKDTVRLRQIVGDEEIADWIFDIKKKKSIFRKKKVSKKDKYLTDIHSILDKMEAWGE